MVMPDTAIADILLKAASEKPPTPVNDLLTEFSTRKKKKQKDCSLQGVRKIK